MSHMPPEKVQAAVTAAMYASSAVYAAQVAIGMGCSVLGGYVAGRIAKHDQLLNGALSSFLCTAVGIYALSSGQDKHSRLVQALLFLASPALGLLGGYLSVPKSSKILADATS
jgi:putative membrane protein (TIGR04086 family)